MIAVILPREGKMKRKIFLLICAVLIAALLIGVLAACDPGSKEQGGTQTPGGTQLPGNGGGGGTQTPGDNDQDDEQGGEVIEPAKLIFEKTDAGYSVTGYEGTPTVVVIPDTHEGLPVTSIGDYAFSGCTSLTSITIPDSVTSIGSSAFSGCYKLIEVCNKSSLGITAGSTANGYVGCYAKHVYTEEGGSWLTDTEDGFRFFYDGETGYLVAYLGNETELTLPESFTAYDGTEVTNYQIYERAFYGRDDLTAITIADSVTSIGGYAFSGCTAEIIWGGTPAITEIGDYAFADYAGTNITIPDSVTSIGSYAFRGCTSLTSITIPDSVTSIGESAFNSCTRLTSVTIGNSVTSIWNDAFYFCASLTSITIPDSVTIIGWYAFFYCTSLTSVTIGNGVTSICEGAFAYCDSLTSVTFDGTVEQWEAVDRGSSWHDGCPFTEVECSDGNVSV